MIFRRPPFFVLFVCFFFFNNSVFLLHLLLKYIDVYYYITHRIITISSLLSNDLFVMCVCVGHTYIYNLIIFLKKEKIGFLFMHGSRKL